MTTMWWPFALRLRWIPQGPGYGGRPVVPVPECPNCACIEHQHSGHKLVVWEFEAKLRPARAKRPGQLRWKMGDLLEIKGRQAAYAKCATGRGELAKIVAGAYAPGYTTDVMEAAIVAELKQPNLGTKCQCLVRGAHTMIMEGH